jgi:hypothetical protein
MTQSRYFDPAGRVLFVATGIGRKWATYFRKLVKRIHELDLSPIDEEIAELQQRIGELQATREIVLKIRGGANAASNNGSPAGEPPLIERIKRYIKRVGLGKVPIIAADLKVSTGDVLAACRADNELEESIAGWKFSD